MGADTPVIEVVRGSSSGSGGRRVCCFSSADVFEMSDIYQKRRRRGPSTSRDVPDWCRGEHVTGWTMRVPFPDTSGVEGTSTKAKCSVDDPP